MKQASPIKIFVDAHVLDKEFQGTRTFIKEIYTHLSRNENLRVYLGVHDKGNLQNIFSENSNITFITYNRKSSYTRLLYSIPSILQKNKIDFAHFQYIVPPVKRCKYIVTIHDVIFKEHPREFPIYYRVSREFLFKKATAKADIITTVSDYSKKSIEKFLHAKPGRVHIIPNGVSESFFKPYDKQQSKKKIKDKYGIGENILYVSRFEPRKNHESLLKAYLELELFNKGYFLVLLGYQSLKVNGFNKMINDLPQAIRKFIYINSEINDEDLMAFYQSASVFIYPSKAEGFGISPLEAAAVKIPVICSNTTAMKDFSFFGNMHIDPSDYNLLKKKLIEILTNPPDESQLQNIADTIRQKYSWKRSAEDFYQLLLHSHAERGQVKYN